MTGKFITFEGIEGCGKSTQIKLLDDHLRGKGHKTALTREPGGTKIGDKIRGILLDPANKEMQPLTELLLYIASRSQHTEGLIKPAMAAGKMVLCDRYADSSVAYQGAARKLSAKVVEQLNTLAMGGIKPDLTIILDISAEEGLKRASHRGNLDRFEQEEIRFHEDVRSGYLRLAKMEPKRIVVINGLQEINNIHQEIVTVISSKFGL